MWIILLFVYVIAILPNNAQEFTSFEAQTATETYANSNVNGNSTRPPVTLTIRNGRAGNVDRTISQNSGPLYYSREWQRVLMPIGFNSDKDNETYVNENEHYSHYQFVPTFIQHPDVEANNTVPNQYSLIGEINQFSSNPVSYQYPFIYFQSNSNSTSDSSTTNADQIYADALSNENAPRNAGNFQTFDFYRNAKNIESAAVPFQSSSQFNSNVENIENNAEQNQLILSADTLPIENVPRNIGNFQPFDSYRNDENIEPALIPFQGTYQSSFSSSDDKFKNDEKFEINTEQKRIPSSGISELTNTDPTRINEEFIKPLSIDNSNLAKKIPNLENFYANSQRYFPQIIPTYFPPYPFVPLQRSNAFQQILPFSSSYPNFDRELGSEVNERIQVPQKEIISGDVADHTAENVPSEAAVSIIPSQPLPSAVPRYSFGPYLPTFAPHLTPNIPPSNIPLRPLPLPIPRTVQREVIPDVLLPPPVAPLKPLTDVIPETLPQTDSLIPEEQTSIIKEADINTEESVSIEKSNFPKIPYEFGFEMSDGKGNDQHRKEMSDISGVVTGSYGYVNKENGIYRIVIYTADKDGFKPKIFTNEPGMASSNNANVMVIAENPPPRVVSEFKNDVVPVISAASDPNAELIPPGRVQEIK